MKKRMPAEWENPRAILMTYPNRNTDWANILEEACNQFDAIIEVLIQGREYVKLIGEENDIRPRIRRLIEDNEGCIYTDVPYNDTWTRDYGPITVYEGREDGKNHQYLLDFGFNGWGLKFASDKDNLVNLRMKERKHISLHLYRNCRDFVLEGGSIETDGRGTILTTSRCLQSPNRNGGKTKEEIELILSEKLGASHFLWLDYGFLEGDDTDSHIDTLARMAPEDTIVYVAPPKNEIDIHYSELIKMREQLQGFRTLSGNKYRLIPLPFPDPIYDENGERLPATYANYLVTGWNLYMPTYNQPGNDAKAKEGLQQAFPNHKIYTVDCSTLIKQHGSLHCSTMQLY